MKKQGIVKTVTFHNPDNGYSVLKLSYPRESGDFTVVGIFPRLKPGEHLELAGEWSQHPKFGRQFKSSGFRMIAPETAEHMEQYLGSGLFKGVGPAQAKILVEAFGENTFQVLDTEPEKVKRLPRLTRKKAENILNRWKETRTYRDVLYFLQSHGLSLNLSVKIYKHYGGAAVEKIKANPYVLAHDIWGVGFIKADHIAQKLGVDPESYERIKAGLVHCLTTSSQEGHLFLPKDELVLSGSKVLQVPPELLVYTLDNLVNTSDIYRDDEDNFYLPYLYYSETGIARKFSELQHTPPSVDSEEVAKGIRQAEASFSKGKNRFLFSAQQKWAITSAVSSGISLITGGPGTGKSTLLLAILRILRSAGHRVKLTAPTGRAAKRMQSLCDHPASTIHRLLQYEPESRQFKFNESQPLETDALIVDEVSMIDTSLMYALLRALKPGTITLLVGDPNQLPSVGPGQVLSEIINSKQFPHTHLEEIQRQESGSPIVTGAHRVIGGNLPVFPPENRDMVFEPMRKPGEAMRRARMLLQVELPNANGYHPLWDVQILTPMNRGAWGTQAINAELQSSINPDGKSVTFRDMKFKVGDKVMQIKNNYDKNVFNGDLGEVASVGPDNELRVLLDDRRITYAWEELEQLNLAYAVSIHKSQGNEFKAVILILSDEHHLLLQRNLLYTAMTRAREKLYILGSDRALAKAVRNNPAVARNTRLAGHLQRKMAVAQDLPF